MFSRLREPFGKAGLTVAILALVLAMVGGAYAAGGLTKSQEKQVTKIAKKYAGKPGAPGAAGANGTNGTNGKDGAPGAKGETGSGTQGIQGEHGKNVVTTNITTAGLEGHCVGTGGTKFQVEGSATKEYVCNGANGTTGFTATLPAGATETGAWSFGPTPEGAFFVVAPISFAIPLGGVLDGAHVHFVATEVSTGVGTGNLTSGSKIITNAIHSSGAWGTGSEISGAGIPAGTTIVRVTEPEVNKFELKLSANATATATGVALTAGPPAACQGSAAAPTATSGNLCVYEGGITTYEENSFTPVPASEEGGAPAGAATAGAMLEVRSRAVEPVFPGTLDWGTFAVTG